MASTLPSPGEARSPSPAPSRSRRERALVASCIGVVTALAWAYLVHLNRHMTAPTAGDPMMGAMGMVTRSWGARDLLLTFAMWSVMMVGMMALSALPVLLLYAGMRTQRADRGLVPAVPSFGLGYLVVWLGFSALATAAQWALHEAALLSPAMATSSTAAGGVILIAAGVYQLTPLKAQCLTQCRSPLGFLMSRWREGSGGALVMGFRHGLFCLGCCWALMAVLFAVGVMNLAWVGLLTLFILGEKIGPAGTRLARAGGAVLIALGAVLVSGW